MARAALILLLLSAPAALFGVWYQTVGFDPRQVPHWQWLGGYLRSTGSLPEEMLFGLYGTGGYLILGVLVIVLVASRASARSVSGGRGSSDLHGSARWAKWRDVVKAGLTGKTGVVVGRDRLGIGQPVGDQPPLADAR